MNRLLLAASLALGILASSAYAADSKDPYYTITKVQFKEVVPTSEEIYLTGENFEQVQHEPSLLSPDLGSGLGDVGVILDQVIMIGQKIINIIRAGAPVVNVHSDVVHVVPQGITSWQQLAGWQAPVSRVYALSMNNGLGLNVVNVRVKISGSYGGNYDGKGKFLSNVYMVPSEINVMWGFNLDMNMESHTPLNTGTKLNPVAGLGLTLKYTVKGLVTINEIHGAQDYFFKGDGSLQAL